MTGSDELKQAKRWRDRAEELRAYADEFRSDAKESILRLAAELEWRAEKAEQRATPPPSKPAPRSDAR